MAKAEGWESRRGCLDRHIWSGDKIELAAARTLHTVKEHRIFTIYAAAVGLGRGGWLEAAVDSAANPLDKASAYTIARFLPQLAANPKYRTLLGTALTELQQADIVTVFTGIDTLVEKIMPAARAQYSQRLRSFLSTPSTALASGDLVRDVPFITSWPEPPRIPRDTLSDRPHPGLSDSVLAQPAAALKFDDLNDLRKKQIDHFEGRNGVLIAHCAKILDSHESAVEAIRAARKTGIDELNLPKALHKHIVDKKKIPHPALPSIPKDAVLPICVYLLDANELHKNHYGVRLPSQAIDAFAPLCHLGSFAEQFGILLSERYLTRFVLMACLALLMLETNWNVSVVLSLTDNRIEEIDGKYYIYGFKSKSDQNQAAEISSIADAPDSSTPPSNSSGLLSAILDEEKNGRFEISNPATVRAIKLLLAHRKNIDDDWKTDTRQLFLLMSLRPSDEYPTFRIPRIDLELTNFCEFIKHPPFWIEDLRKQKVNTRYLRTLDLRQAQADLMHKSPTTTLTYINGTALRLAHETIIKYFSEILSDACLYSSGRLIINPDRSDRKSKLIKNLLLFPPSALHAEDGSNIADQWLKSNGKISFEIGISEIQFCIYQKRYYKKNCAKLVYENPKRFNKYHLPRIIFCEALYRFLASSPLGSKLKELEGAQQ